MRFRGRRALVTGGASGIGRAFADGLRKEGADVAVADLRLDPPLDVTRAADLRLLHDDLAARDALPDLLVLAAGVGVHERLAEGDPETWARVLDVNVMGALRAVRAFVPAMLARGAGDVVFVSSVAARKPYPYGGVYAASKAALDAAAETLRLETAPRVRVLVVRYGAVDTPFFERAPGHPGLASLGWGPLSPEAAVAPVLDALAAEPHVAVHEIVVRPPAQGF